MSKRSELSHALLRGCRSASQLADWALVFTHLRVPGEGVCPGHDAPLAYLWHAYREPSSDAIVWASRFGGKTRLGALATLLDLLHKPGTNVRILGGSAEQSLRMWEHLLPDVLRLAPTAVVRARSIRLPNGSAASVLAQSQRSVRGHRVQKMRCDELELFDPAVWQAAQLTTRSLAASSGRAGVAGVVEAMSTHHRVGGLMSSAIDGAASRGVRVFRWCLMEVLERCGPDRACDACGLEPDCRGIAKTRCDGFVSIDDALRMKRRVSVEAWACEMLCRRPSVLGSVFPSFDTSLHVVRDPSPPGGLSLAIDFGFANPLVCLWIDTRSDGSIHVIDEYVQSGRTLWEHLEQIESRPWGKVPVICCDPAGSGRNDQTAESNVQLLKRRGYRVRTRGSRIIDGLERMRAMLNPALGPSRLTIDPRCVRLIAAMQGYRYAGGELPLKDGTHDHPIDALRYHVVNSEARPLSHRTY